MIAAEQQATIVFERDGEWTRALRRFVSAEIPVREGPPIDRLPMEPCRDVPWVSVAVIDSIDHWKRVLAWAEEQSQLGQHNLRMAVVRPANHELAWCLRESGVALVCDEFWQTPRMADVIQRFWRMKPLAVLSPEQRIWNNLPWKE